MKRTVIKRLNQRGFLHHAVPIVAFVVLFAVIGAIFYLRSSRAATPQYWFEATANGSYCIAKNGSAAQLRACGSGSNATVSNIGANYNGHETAYISIGGTCLWRSGGSGLAFNSGCKDNLDDEWVLNGSKLESFTSLRDGQGDYCVSSKTVNGALSVQACGASGYYQGWYKAQAPGSVSTGGGTSTSSTVDFTRTPVNCHANVYTQAKNGGVFNNCVGAIQQMVGSMDQFDFFNGKAIIGVDGLYGPQTTAAVRAYQVYEKSPVSVDGQVGSQTWHYLCWSIHNRGLTNTKATGNNARTARAWYYAECNTDYSTPAGK